MMHDERWEFMAPHWVDFNAEEDKNADKWFDLCVDVDINKDDQLRIQKNNPIQFMKKSKLPRRKRDKDDPLNFPDYKKIKFKERKNNTGSENYLNCSTKFEKKRNDFTVEGHLRPPALKSLKRFDICV